MKVNGGMVKVMAEGAELTRKDVVDENMVELRSLRYIVRLKPLIYPTSRFVYVIIHFSPNYFLTLIINYGIIVPDYLITWPAIIL